MDWSKEANYPRPDYLSSSRKRLAPQLLFKGGILHSWKKKIAVALNKSFFATLPPLKQVPKSKADIAWLIYDLELLNEKDQDPGRYSLKKVDEVLSPGSLEFYRKLINEEPNGDKSLHRIRACPSCYHHTITRKG